MKTLIVILGALTGAVVGWIATAALVIAFGGSFGLTDFEGQRAMAAVFGFGPMGGLVGLVVGAVLTLWRQRQ